MLICQWFCMEKSKDAIIENVLKDIKIWNFFQDCTKDLHSIISHIHTTQTWNKPLKSPLSQKGLNL